MTETIISRYNSQDHYKALRDDYKTPPHIYEPILKYFKREKFDIDVCCTDKNIPAEKHFTKEENGLNQPWNGLCFCNPPWNQSIKFVKKAIAEMEKNNELEVVFVLSSDKMYINYVQDFFLNNPDCVFFVLRGKQGFIIPGKEDEPLQPSVGTMVAILSKKAAAIQYGMKFYNLYKTAIFQGQKLSEYAGEIGG